VVLPEPDFADHAQRFALRTLRLTPSIRLDMPDRVAQQTALDRKPDFQIVGRYHHRKNWAAAAPDPASASAASKARV